MFDLNIYIFFRKIVQYHFSLNDFNEVFTT